MKLFKVLILFCLLFFSCNSIHEGTIVDKYIVPEHTIEYITYMQTDSVSIPQIHITFVPEEFVLIVKNKKCEYHTESLSVDSTIYSSLQKGDRFSDTIKCIDTVKNKKIKGC
jgi:hypothetical protein